MSEQNERENSNQDNASRSNTDEANSQNENPHSEEHAPEDPQDAQEPQDQVTVDAEIALQQQLNLLMMQNLQEFQRRMQLFLNENYLKDLKREFLKFKIFFFHDDNQNYTELTTDFIDKRFSKFREEIVESLNKTFEAFDEQEINFKIDRLYKWNRIVRSGDIDFFIFYREDQLEAKDKRIHDPLFCKELMHPTLLKDLLPQYQQIFSRLQPEADSKLQNETQETEKIDNDESVKLKEQLSTKDGLTGVKRRTNLFGDFDEPMAILNRKSSPQPEIADQSMIRNISNNYTLLQAKPEIDPPTEPISDAAQTTPENTQVSTPLQPTVRNEEIAPSSVSTIGKILPKSNFTIDPNRSFEEFFNVNPQTAQVAQEYQEILSNIITKGDYLSFPINNEFVVLLRPKKSSVNKQSLLLRYQTLLKTSIMPYLSTSDLLTFRLANRDCQDIIKSVWHSIYKQEMSEQVINVRIEKYVCSSARVDCGIFDNNELDLCQFDSSCRKHREFYSKQRFFGEFE